MFKRSTPAVPDPDLAATTYAYRSSLIGSAQRFELADAGLVFRAGRMSGIWAYADIVAMRLSYRPISLQARRFRADISHANGQRLSIFSTTWQTATLVTPQDHAYRAFIEALHRRLAEAGGPIRLSGGLRPWVHHIAVGVMALLAAAMAALLVRAVAIGEVGGVLFLVGFAALFGWQIGGFLRRNTPRRYDIAALPDDLLPR